jgi:GTP-binding protein EngB required for normal cell division
MLLESLVVKLVTTLSGYFLEGYLDSLQYNKIDGAPTWYGDTSGDKLMGYGYTKGGIETIEIAKTNCRMDIVKKINNGIEVVIYDNFKHVKEPDEKELIQRFKHDTNLDVFVTKSMSFDKVEHQKQRDESLFQDARINQTFTQCSVNIETLIKYQKERLTQIKKELVQHKSNKAFDELDKEVNQ